MRLIVKFHQRSHSFYFESNARILELKDHICRAFESLGIVISKSSRIGFQIYCKPESNWTWDYLNRNPTLPLNQIFSDGCVLELIYESKSTLNTTNGALINASPQKVAKPNVTPEIDNEKNFLNFFLSSSSASSFSSFTTEDKLGVTSLKISSNGNSFNTLEEGPNLEMEAVSPLRYDLSESSFFDSECSTVWRSIDSLPDEILKLIFFHLDTGKDLTRTQLTCKRWRKILIDPSNDLLWKKVMFNLWKIPIELGTTSWRRACLNLSKSKLRKIQKSFIKPNPWLRSNLRFRFHDLKLTVVPSSCFDVHKLKILYLSRNKLEIIPSRISELTSLTQLDASHNLLTSISNEICLLSSLLRLSMSHNCITDIPATLTQLQALEILNLRHNSISILPSFFNNFSRLRQLVLSGNRIQTLPSIITEMTSLTLLRLSKNFFYSIPSLPTLVYLRRLSFSKNNLTTVPSLTHLTNLTILDISKNAIQQIGDLPLSLQQVDISANNLQEFPFPVLTLTNLTYLKLNNNPISFLPSFPFLSLEKLGLNDCPITSMEGGSSFFLKLTKLDQLFISELDNLMTPVPDLSNLSQLNALMIKSSPKVMASLNLIPVLYEMANLRYLFLINCGIDRLNDNVSKLTNLVSLDLSSNLLYSLPSSIACLTKLKRLILTRNLFVSIPNQLIFLTDLEVLSMEENVIDNVSPNLFFCLTKLEELSLAHNKITVLPYSLTCLVNLKTFNFNGNSLSSEINFSTLPRLRYLNSRSLSKQKLV